MSYPDLRGGFSASHQLRNAPTSKEEKEGEWSGNTNLPEAIEAVLRAVDGEYGCAGIGLCHAPVPLQDDHFGPDLVVDRMPLAENLIDVVLKDRGSGTMHKGREEGSSRNDIYRRRRHRLRFPSLTSNLHAAHEN